MRVVIFHYHLFKNAGTSLDALFQERFADRWATREFPPARGENHRAVTEWVGSSTGTVCFSSHTAQLPPPTIPGVAVIPAIFVRHPLDRIASAYAFERQQGDPGFGSTLARNTTLRGYIETRLAVNGDRQCRNFHTQKFAQLFDDGTPELDRALRALDALPFVGLVEKFAESLARLQRLLISEGFEGVDLRPVRRNSSARLDTLESRLDAMATEVGRECYEELERVNGDDLQFYKAARNLLA
ncbi:MAG TPA: hypothetical protein VF062_17165 [Candidatus Limnocylindrales bacterium]